MQTEIIIRAGSFLAVFVLIALWETKDQRRSLTTAKRWRWFNNLSIILINTLTVRLVFPVLAVNIAIKAQQSEWGLLNNFDLPYWVSFVIGIVVLDLAIYLQHVMFHAVPTLWRLHMMHHADLDYDLTTGLRFHPLEMLLSMGIKMTVVAALGPPSAAVLTFEILLKQVPTLANIRPKSIHFLHFDSYCRCPGEAIVSQYARTHPSHSPPS